MGSTGLFGIGADKWKAGADAFGKASYGLKQAGVLDQPQQPQAQRPPMSQPMGATMPLYGQDDLQSKIAMLSPDERRKLEMMLQQRGYA